MDSTLAQGAGEPLTPLRPSRYSGPFSFGGGAGLPAIPAAEGAAPFGLHRHVLPQSGRIPKEPRRTMTSSTARTQVKMGFSGIFPHGRAAFKGAFVGLPKRNGTRGEEKARVEQKNGPSRRGKARFLSSASERGVLSGAFYSSTCRPYRRRLPAFPVFLPWAVPPPCIRW